MSVLLAQLVTISSHNGRLMQDVLTRMEDKSSGLNCDAPVFTAASAAKYDGPAASRIVEFVPVVGMEVDPCDTLSSVEEVGNPGI